MPFSLKSIEDIVKEEKEELLSSIYTEVEDDLNYRVKLDIEIQIVQNSQKRNMKKMILVIERYIL